MISELLFLILAIIFAIIETYKFVTGEKRFSVFNLIVIGVFAVIMFLQKYYLFGILALVFLVVYYLEYRRKCDWLCIGIVVFCVIIAVYKVMM